MKTKTTNRLKNSAKSAYEYGICGLKLVSNVPFVLPKGRRCDNGRPDIRFALKSAGNPPEDIFASKLTLGNIKNGAGQPSISVYRSERLYLLDCHNTNRRVQFVMSRADGWIDCYPQSGATKQDIEVWLFGLVLAFFLQHRGIFSLHAAAVECQGRAIVFIGHNGYGKSTLASFFLQKGHSLLTDDILPLIEKDGTFNAMPVCPAMNLWSQTFARIKGAEIANGNGNNNIAKRRYSLRNLRLQFAKSAAPLGTIYFLRPTTGNGSTPVQITPIPKAKSLIDLLSNTRANSMIEASKQPELFKTYADLVSKIPVCQLEYGRGFDLLPSVYDEILSHNFRNLSRDTIFPPEKHNPITALG